MLYKIPVLDETIVEMYPECDLNYFPISPLATKIFPNVVTWNYRGNQKRFSCKRITQIFALFRSQAMEKRSKASISTGEHYFVLKSNRFNLTSSSFLSAIVLSRIFSYSLFSDSFLACLDRFDFFPEVSPVSRLLRFKSFGCVLF